MANKITSVSIIEILETNRFEPKLFVFQTLLKHAKSNYRFVTLASIATNIKRGQSPKPETYMTKNQGKYIFVRTADVKKYQINSETAVYLDEDTFATQKSNRVKAGDVLISVVGNYLGSTGVIPQNINIGAFNDNSACIRIIDKNISPFYVSAFFNSNFGQKLIQSSVTRTGQKILSAGNVKQLPLPIVEDSEVVCKYKSATEKLAKSNTLIDKAQQLLYSSIGVKFKDVEKINTFSVNKNDFAYADLWTSMYSYPLYVNTLKAIQLKWKTSTIGEIADVKKGDEVGSESYIGYMDKRKTDIPFVRTSDIVNYEVDHYPDFYIPVEIYKELNQGLKAGDVLFTKDGKIGMVGMITECDEVIISSGIAGLRLNSKAKEYNITPEYLFICLSIKEIGIYAAKRRTVVASTIPHLREEKLKEIEIPILDKSVVDEITDMVRQAFALKNEKKRLIEDVRELMDNYFDV